MAENATEKRRFLIIAPDFYPINGGYANATTNFAKALAQHGKASVTVVTPTQLVRASELEVDGLTVCRLERYRGRFRYRALVEQVFWGRRIASMLASDDHDFVLFETLENPITAYLAVRRLSKERLRRVAIRIHATNATEGYLYGEKALHRLYWRLVRRVVERVPNVLATTGYYIDFAKHRILLGNVYRTFKNYGVVPNVVFPAEAVEVGSGAEERRRAASDKLELLCLGRLNANGYNQKNFELVLQALFLMRRHNRDLYDRVRVTLIGSGEFQELLLDMASRLGVVDRLDIRNSVPHEEVRRLQESSAAVLLVSRYEGQSMFALEALAVGAPLIVAKGTGVEGLVEDGRNGFWVDPDDPYSLLTAIGRIAEFDLDRFGQRSKEIYAERLHPDRCVRKFLDFVDMSIASHKIEAS